MHAFTTAQVIFALASALWAGLFFGFAFAAILSIHRDTYNERLARELQSKLDDYERVDLWRGVAERR